MQLPPFLSCSQPMAVVSSNCIPSLILGSLSQLGRRSLGCPSLSPKLTHPSNLSLHCSLNVPENAHEDTPMEKRFPPYPTVMDINQIRERLPHRFPFLLVDRIIEYNPGVSVVGIKNVTINDNFFPGHFPERPIMPGVLMIEAMSQVGGAVILEPDVKGTSGEVFFLAGVDKVRFRKPVIPGDTLVMRMTLMKMHKRFGVAKLEGKAYVGSELVCEGEFLMATGSDPQARFLYP